MSNREDYTVGWICAISTEYVAAQTFLDKKHEWPEYVSTNDNNDYTLGKIGKHNVVIAVLPDGEYGLATAAGVARDMVHSFPNVRIGLMVGIAGGAPSKKHDIRLGDIVVGAPRDRESGVFEFDFGKTIQGQDFEYTKFLDQPPPVLRAAMNGLKAQYEIEGHKIEEAINSILKKNPRLQRKYKRPSTDRLYQPGVTHPSEGEARLASCAEVCADDKLSLIYRPKRTEHEDNPAIHYGLIASSNQLMKDAIVRDRLVEKKDVLCFEMEAAGLVNHFPCLVVRGICDYSDTHKNKEWQGYAAMAAAAYTKDLLYRIAPNKVEAEKRITDIVFGVQKGVDKLLRMQHNQEYETILRWLTPIDYTPQQNDYVRRRQLGTGQWLLDSAEFQTWLDTGKKTLFCPGIPGAGKTIITSIVIEYLFDKFRHCNIQGDGDTQDRSIQNDGRIGIAYLYCNFRQQEEQKAEELLASLLKQLAQEHSAILSTVKDLYNRHKIKQTRPSFDEISKALQSAVVVYSTVFIVIDALDECQVRTRLLPEIFNLQIKSGVSIFATSRFIPDIIEKFRGSISVEIRATEEDVQRYLDGRISESESVVLKSCREDIKTKITKAVNGMFLLAQLHFQSIRTKKTLKRMKDTLKSLPTGLKAYDQAYNEAMERITGQDLDTKELAKQVLSWITCAKRPLTTLELRHALAVEAGGSELDEENLPETEDMVSVCAGLVTVDEESDIIRLVHYTTQEYFERTWTSWFPNTQRSITEICVTYLSFDVFETGFCLTNEKFEERLQLNPLYNYAARNWGHHAYTTSTEVEKLILGLLESETKKSAASQAMLASREGSRYSDYSQDVPKQMTGVHLAAYFGLTGVVMALLKNRHNPDVKDTYKRTPLSWAAGNGHEAVVKLLLEKGAAPDSRADYRGGGRTPLSRAAGNGHEAVVKLLLEKG